MALPDTYNTSTLRLDPGGLNTVLTTLTTAITEIVTDIDAVMTSLNSLKLSWTGDSATTMQIFQDRWYAAVTALYGTETDPSTGILNILTSGLATALANYDQCELNVADMFDRFERTLAANSSDGGGTPVDQPYGAPQKNYHTTSINETF